MIGFVDEFYNEMATLKKKLTATELALTESYEANEKLKQDLLNAELAITEIYENFLSDEK